MSTRSNRSTCCRSLAPPPTPKLLHLRRNRTLTRRSKTSKAPPYLQQEKEETIGVDDEEQEMPTAECRSSFLPNMEGMAVEIHVGKDARSVVDHDNATLLSQGYCIKRLQDKPCSVDDVARRKMEQQRKAVADKGENKHALILPNNENSWVGSSTSTCNRMITAFPGISSTRHELYQEAKLDDIKCSGRCKTMIRRVVEQVRTETEQWSQMQEMLNRVREEMEELQVSRLFWETQAHKADCKIQSLRHMVQEWKQKALNYKNKANHIQEAHMLQLKKEKLPGLSCRVKTRHLHRINEESLHELHRDARRMTHSNSIARDRTPLRDIGNSATS